MCIRDSIGRDSDGEPLIEWDWIQMKGLNFACTGRRNGVDYFMVVNARCLTLLGNPHGVCTIEVHPAQESGRLGVSRMYRQIYSGENVEDFAYYQLFEVTS
eukprot:TRINITY_DN13800_c0_g1_i2.p1 TRINITY_DN13800_c0_g1~~TRINITY_DN13800_c0_g1_i2.p1  ORF type:complete len:101 (+),score=5.14 TRINITY_DN13800_c0_g1_i2:63-365(+)